MNIAHLIDDIKMIQDHCITTASVYNYTLVLSMCGGDLGKTITIRSEIIERTGKLSRRCSSIIYYYTIRPYITLDDVECLKIQIDELKYCLGLVVPGVDRSIENMIYNCHI